MWQRQTTDLKTNFYWQWLQKNHSKFKSYYSNTNIVQHDLTDIEQVYFQHTRPRGLFISLVITSFIILITTLIDSILVHARRKCVLITVRNYTGKYNFAKVHFFFDSLHCNLHNQVAVFSHLMPTGKDLSNCEDTVLSTIQEGRQFTQAFLT